LIVEVAAATLSPTHGLHLSVPIEEDWIVGEELPAEVEEGAVESEPEAPIDLHFFNTCN
jgi:hypothetical protein